MNNTLDTYNYSRQFILVEDQDKKIRKRVNSDVELIDIDDYLWKVITTISMQSFEGKVYHLIQQEEKKLEWKEMKDPKKKIRKRVNSDVEPIDIYDYLWKVITTISMQSFEGKVYHLIQHEDKKLGWIELEDSIQILRFPAQHYKVIEERFNNNEINS